MERMKRAFLLTIVILLALCGAATDRFYIEDFDIAHGETRTVNILLDNQTAYTAFQCDIYMPEGLTIEQEGGCYSIDLTSRKAQDHNIALQAQANGSIRIISFSPNVNVYSGNNGALVTIDVVASENFVGPASITLRGTLFTTTTGVEVPFDDETCIVTLSSTVIRGDVNGDGKVSINDVTALIDLLLGGVTVSNDAADFNEDGNVSISDVTTLIDFLLSGN